MASSEIERTILKAFGLEDDVVQAVDITFRGGQPPLVSIVRLVSSEEGKEMTEILKHYRLVLISDTNGEERNVSSSKLSCPKCGSDEGQLSLETNLVTCKCGNKF